MADNERPADDHAEQSADGAHETADETAHDTSQDSAHETTQVPAAGPYPDPAATTQAPTGPRLRDRMWSLRSMIAVGVAALLIGGAGGAGIVAATHGDGHDRHRFGRFADGPGGGMGQGPGHGPRFRNGGPGGPGFGGPGIGGPGQDGGGSGGGNQEDGPVTPSNGSAPGTAG